uniref:Uncharacterized protein n=1 Tax=Pithovirus LCPAC406 TaxID=2506599 RepID=A0A481ZDN6_9VIRU|nr:MAG: hypothetical protein LCPAC406_03320 [Pithovirus LCPAC406]
MKTESKIENDLLVKVLISFQMETVQDQFIDAIALLSKVSDRILNVCTSRGNLNNKQLEEEDKELTNLFHILIVNSDIAASSEGIQKIIIDILNNYNTTQEIKKYYRYQLLLSILKYEQKQRKIKNL